VLYLANPCGNAAITAALRGGHLGYIDTPKQGNTRPAGVLWCADNGSYGMGWPGYGRWFAWLEKHAADADQCLFATAPDVVANHFATGDRSRPWLQRIRDLGYPVAFVAQNYMELSTWDLWDEVAVTCRIAGRLPASTVARLEALVSGTGGAGRWELRYDASMASDPVRDAEACAVGFWSTGVCGREGLSRVVRRTVMLVRFGPCGRQTMNVFAAACRSGRGRPPAEVRRSRVLGSAGR
jgi:hypothetical protein